MNSRLFHPLCGSNLGTLVGLLVANGAPAPRRLPALTVALMAVLLRWPFSTAEWLLSERRRARRGPMPAPVFIVGYWRSGTTHLHNVLARDPQFGHVSPLAAGLPWDVLGIVRWLAPLLERVLPRDRYVDGVPVTPDSPQEDSIALANMGAPSYYHGLYFPRRFAHHFRRGVFFTGCGADEIARWRRALEHFLEKVSIQQGGRRLLMKNPVYTAHVGRLQAIWPQAKFIHIYRNPYVLLPSTRHFFRRLLPELALQAHADLDVDALVLESYPRMMEALAQDAARLPRGSFVELRFEDFEADPLPELERIYETLALPGFGEVRPRFLSYLEGTRGYRKNRYPADPVAARLVEQHWAPFIERLGYKAQAAASIT